MSVKIVNPLNQKNKSNLESSENLNKEFYERVNNGTVDDMEKYLTFLSHDVYKDLLNNKTTSIDDIMK